MKRKLLLLMLINFSIAGAVYAQNQLNENYLLSSNIEWQQAKYGKEMIAVGNITTKVIDKVKFKPDIAEFTVTYTTEANNYRDAASQNAEKMKIFNQFLVDSGVNEKDLTTVSYRNYENEINQPIDSQSKQYRSTYLIHLNIDQAQFFNTIELLDKHNIHDISQESNQAYYVFELEQLANSQEQAKQLIQQQYQIITDELKKLGNNSMTITAYGNQEISPKTTIVKTYNVKNTLKIKVRNFDLISKIMTKAQEMNIIVNDDLNYDVSDEAIEQILQQHEQTLYNKLANKVGRLIGKQYKLGDAISLNYYQQNNSFSNRPKLYAGAYKQYASESKRGEMVEIQTPEEFEMEIILDGSFEITRSINSK
ncbi:SIMPL domain-containing protein [Frischella sp. Ac48]|uniref:SIMPL domain-containing protein n=1 Tax=Frischella japonica TaxID=2741544 RepID=A0ABR7QXG4_9GAMM|nr:MULTISPECIES: SIMPL domain-containing protein [Frischella]MBC9130916.1 SIMPL domain-containing protein [Frischella japonica]MBX4133734.1 SIMPL domain-containing protein [Frischella sp. Ac48]